MLKMIENLGAQRQDADLIWALMLRHLRGDVIKGYEINDTVQGDKE